uniref:RNA polymerase sigma factor n=1 Tax=candidate division WOR-3 bacterium TaxID=2052148 RepID=A0A7C6E959_UNCW3
MDLIGYRGKSSTESASGGCPRQPRIIDNATDDYDLALVKRIRAQEEDWEMAFEQLVMKYQHSVLNTIYRYIGNYNEAEDIAQNVFIKVWHKIKTFKKKAKFSTWLYRIVVNQCLDYQRKKKKEGTVSLDDKLSEEKIPESLTVELDSEQKKKSAIIKQAINELPANQRIALILSKYENKSYQEIADIMGISLGAVAALISRAKESLKTKLIPLREKGII